MTDAQREAREERIAIMIFDGGISEQEAIDYCNRNPSIYGIDNIQTKQGELWHC